MLTNTHSDGTGVAGEGTRTSASGRCNPHWLRRLLFSACVALASGGAANAASMDDAQILGIYIQVNSFDIETALLGRAHAQSDPVRRLAEHVASDHMGVRQAAQALAIKCNVVPVLPLERQAAATVHGETLTALSALKGAAFDRAYLQHEVSFHRAAIDALRTGLLPAVKCPALAAHLQSVLPAFEEHLAHTEMLARDATAE